MDNFSDDEIFGTLGGSLMKDLLADLQVGEGDFSLDQLEKELATLDDAPPQFQHQPLPALDAASLVVSHAQDQAVPLTQAGNNTTGPRVDAWSLSLQNFTAMSLQDDFLAADSARKKQQVSAPTLQPTMLEGAEDYDVGEKIKVVAPPGLGVSLPQPPDPAPFPKTPQNSTNIPAEEAARVFEAPPAPEEKEPPPPTAVPAPAPEVKPTPRTAVAVPSGHPGQQPVMHSMPPPQGMPPGVNVHMIPPQQMAPPPQAMTPHGPAAMIGAPPARGPAWQTPVHAPQPPQPVVRAFCNPHPAASPIPAAALETKYMTARDIAYVVHAILRPVLSQGISEDDYYVQFLRRLGGQATSTMPAKPKDVNGEMLSRAIKSKEWSTEKGILGHVAKANVARPRALIATPAVAKTEQDSEQKQRATLWKARIYCDQAYQAYQAVVDVWRSAPPGAVPPQIQMHLVKLMKCMGITNVDKEYKLDGDSLTLLLKLSKGRTLTARVLEQALLPPNAVLAVLPLMMDVLIVLVGKKNPVDKTDDLSSERLFRAIAGVLRQLNTSSDTLLKCFEAIHKNGKASLGSAARMECAHTLLQKGSAVVGQDPSEAKRAAWGQAEGEFMNILQAF